MLSLILNTITKLTMVTPIQLLSKSLTTMLVDKKLSEIIATAEYKIGELYKNFRKNILNSLIINGIIIILAVLAVTVKKISMLCIALISLLTIYMFVRFVVRGIKNLIILIKNWWQISPRVSAFWEYKKKLPLKEMVNKMIEDEFDKVYTQKLNGVQKSLHWIASKTGFVPEKEEIKKKVVTRASSLIMTYVLKNILFRVLSIVLFYSIIFILFVKTAILGASIKMSFVSILFYPFTVLLPMVVKYLGGLF